MSFPRLWMLEAVTPPGCKNPAHVLHCSAAGSLDTHEVHNGSANDSPWQSDFLRVFNLLELCSLGIGLLIVNFIGSRTNKQTCLWTGEKTEG